MTPYRFERLRLEQAQRAKQTRAELKLADIDSGQYTPEQSRYVTALAFTAVRYLVEAQGGTTRLRDFCVRAAAAAPAPWHSAFAETFGLIRETFYEEFERMLDRVR